jgi:hypothetical protein
MRKKILFRFISKQIMFLKQKHKRIKEQLNDPLLQQRIKSFQRKIESEICTNISKAFEYNKNYVIQLLYESNFDKKIILTKIRPFQMNQELLDYCNKEIQNLLKKCLKQKSKLPWNYSAFYKNIELETLKWIRYPISNKRDLLSRLNDVLIFSKQNWKHLHAFVQIIKNNGLVISPTKINLSLNNIHFLGHNIVKKIIINKSLQILDEIKDKNQLPRFLGSLNYISDYYKHFRIICKSHYQELKKNSPLWSNQHTEIIRHVKILTCLGFPSSNTFRIVETNAPKIGREYYVYVVCYHSDI